MRSTLRFDAALVAITALWGATFLWVKDALPHADPLTFLALRFGLGAALLLPLAGRQLASPAPWRRGLPLGLFLFGGFLFQTWGLQTLSPARSAFITGLSVVLVPLVSAALLRRPVHRWALGGAVIALVGLGVLVRPDVGSGLSPGDGWSLLCVLSYALHISLTEPAGQGVSPTALVAVQVLLTFLLSLAVRLALGPGHLESSAALWTGVAASGLLATALAIPVQTWAQAHVPAARAAVLFALEPVFTALFSWALGREGLGGSEVLGGALIVLGVVVGTRTSAPR